MQNKIWLIGCGYMGLEYGKVLKSLGEDYLAIGRGMPNVLKFKKETGLTPIAGGLENFLKTKPPLPRAVIVAVNIENLSNTTLELLRYGVMQILLEKPGVGYLSEMDELVKQEAISGGEVLLAYNRRFYSSVYKAQEIIDTDGGVTSFAFEFTEWSHRIKDMDKHPAEHQNWFLGNSTHVIDTAFFLGGKPKDISCYHKGEKNLKWHPASSSFAGAGESVKGALFSYHANWEAPGRWVIELMTLKHRLIFKPLEQLQIQEIGSVEVKPVLLDDRLDKDFKAGLYRETETFLLKKHDRLCSLSEQYEMLKVYKKMSGYR